VDEKVRVVPVLDLKGGVVVRAERGQRDLYRPIQTRLSANADPVAVASGLRRLFSFSTFYVADLDAIEGRSGNIAAMAALKSMSGHPELWIDAGIADEGGLTAALAEPSFCPVLGSESQTDNRLLAAFRHHPRLILSLDFFSDGYRGPSSFLEDAALWPQRIIVMTLARVGAAAGPDFARLAAIKQRAGSRDVIAAGGVRGEADLHALASLGIAAALVATSLHDGTLTPAQLASLAK
jgi:phosphoribosylformimino-5-aminoimidazole carboxamide ribotide isomerase